jgi:hypothetical protein
LKPLEVSDRISDRKKCIKYYCEFRNIRAPHHTAGLEYRRQRKLAVRLKKKIRFDDHNESRRNTCSWLVMSGDNVKSICDSHPIVPHRLLLA